MGIASRTQIMALLFLVLIALSIITFMVLSLVLHLNVSHLFSMLLGFGPRPQMMFPHS